MGMMKTIKEEGIKPSEKLLKHLNIFYRTATDVLRKQVGLIDSFICLS